MHTGQELQTGETKSSLYVGARTGRGQFVGDEMNAGVVWADIVGLLHSLQTPCLLFTPSSAWRTPHEGKMLRPDLTQAVSRSYTLHLLFQRKKFLRWEF